MNNSAAEIALYLKHGDHEVAVRRTLDLCLDSGNDALIEKAIGSCKTTMKRRNAEMSEAYEKTLRRLYNFKDNPECSGTVRI